MLNENNEIIYNLFYKLFECIKNDLTSFYKLFRWVQNNSIWSFVKMKMSHLNGGAIRGKILVYQIK